MKLQNILIVAALLVLGVGYFYMKPGSKPLRKLPKLGNHKIDKATGDTLWHSIADFKFINQDSLQITQQDVKGKIYVADYFFTTCTTICPSMSKQLNRVYEHFKSNPNVLILSHSVDPETDQPFRLKNYAAQFDANSKKWIFLTGDKVDLYRMARESYLLEASIGDGGPNDFIHTQNFALVDKNRRIRGYYDGLDEKEVNDLINDIEILLKED